jgi:hypothetical protein
MSDELVPCGEPWERQEDEDHKAYAAFLFFIAQGPFRELKEVSLRVFGNAAGKGIAQVKRWAQQYCWEHRADLYDDHASKQILRGLTAARLNLAKTIMKNAQEINENLSMYSPREAAAYTKLAIDVCRSEVGLAQVVVQHQIANAPAPVVEVSLEEYLTEIGATIKPPGVIEMTPSDDDEEDAGVEVGYEDDEDDGGAAPPPRPSSPSPPRAAPRQLQRIGTGAPRRFGQQW